MDERFGHNKSMHLKIWQKGLMLVAVPLALQIIFVSCLIYMQKQTELLADQERHDFAISEKCESIGKAFLGTAGLLMRFQKVRDEEFGRDFDDHCIQVERECKELLDLTSSEPALQEKSLRVEESANRALTFMKQMKAKDSILALMEVKDFHKQAQAAYADFGNAVHELREDMKERKARNPIATQAARDRLHGAIWTGLVASVVLTLILAIYVTRHLSNRVLTMEQNTHRFLNRQQLLPQVGGGDEIAKLDSVFHSMAASVRQAEQRRQEFMAMISHDIRAPLMALLATLNCLDRGVYGNLNETGAERVVAAEGTVDRIIELINELLDVERIESGSLPLRIADEPALKIVESAIENVHQLAENKHIKIEAPKHLDTTVTVTADSQRLVQVLTNMISNAIKYTPEGGVITVNLDDAPDAWQFSVRDTGPGISEEDQQKVFERYVQVDNAANRKYTGSGLGLAICKGLVEAHGGTVAVRSKVGEGSTFVFSIPKNGQTINS